MRSLRLSYWHVGVWMLLWAAAAGMAVVSCLRYNEIAGTDKTPAHIAMTALATLSGPLTGTVANPGAGSAFLTQCLVWAAGLATMVLVSMAPFLVIRRPVPPVAEWVAWSGFLVTSGLWFFFAILSMAVALS